MGFTLGRIAPFFFFLSTTSPKFKHCIIYISISGTEAPIISNGSRNNFFLITIPSIYQYYLSIFRLNQVKFLNFHWFTREKDFSFTGAYCHDDNDDDDIIFVANYYFLYSHSFRRINHNLGDFETMDDGNGSPYQNLGHYKETMKYYANLTNCGTLNVMIGN